MNAIELVFTSPQAVELPIAYHALVQGLLYSVWRETRPFLHDAGFARGLRLFVFGPLEGRYQVAGRRIRFASPLRLEVRSPVSGLLEDLCRALPLRRELRLGNASLRLEQLTLRDQLVFPDSTLIRARSPIALYRTLPDRKTQYFAPGTRNGCRGFGETWRKSWRAWGWTPPPNWSWSRFGPACTSECCASRRPISPAIWGNSGSAQTRRPWRCCTTPGWAAGTARGVECSTSCPHVPPRNMRRRHEAAL